MNTFNKNYVNFMKDLLGYMKLDNTDIISF